MQDVKSKQKINEVPPKLIIDKINETIDFAKAVREEANQKIDAITKENVELKAKVKHLEGVHGTLDAINRAVKEREVKKELEQKIDAVEAKADEVKAIAKAVTETKTPISEETKTEEKPAEEAPVEEKKDEN